MLFGTPFLEIPRHLFKSLSLLLSCASGWLAMRVKVMMMNAKEDITNDQSADGEEDTRFWRRKQSRNSLRNKEGQNISE